MTSGFDLIFNSLFSSRKRSIRDGFPAVDDVIWEMLEEIAHDEKVDAGELASQEFSKAIIRLYQSKSKNVKKWEELSERQKEVAALACLNYSNAEIALKLNISITTVKGHIRVVLRKFGVRGRHQLRYTLRRWDFSSFEDENPSV